MYQFDFTEIIITILYHTFLRYFCLNDVLMMAHIILYCSKRYCDWLSDSDIQSHKRVTFDITSHPNENQILSMLRGSILMDLS